MSISGDIADVSIAEVMQFIHLGGRTGTLSVQAGGRRAEVGFHRGKIISAWAPESKRLGELLVGKSLIDQTTLEEALGRQEAERPRTSLGKILLTSGVVPQAKLREVVAEQIQDTIYDLVTWGHGSFDFALDELRPVDDIAVYPGDILPDINLNTQMVILDALRIFDEKNRRSQPTGGDTEQRTLADEEGVASASESVEELGIVDADSLFDPEEADLAAGLGLEHEVLESLDGGGDEETRPVRLHVVSDDVVFHDAVREAFVERPTTVTPIDLRDAGLTLPGELPPVVLVDLRSRDLGVEDLAVLRRTRARASIVAVIDEVTTAAEVYEAGAVAVLPPAVDAVMPCVENVLRTRSEESGVESIGGSVAGFAKLRRVVANLRSGLLSATVALNLMQVISESVERAIMFLVRGERLVALGAFGFSVDGKPLSTLTSSLEIELSSQNALTEAVDTGQASSVLFDDAELSQHFVDLVGAPRTGQVVVFPVLGSEQVIGVVYTDNGALSREIEEIEILELAAAQVGVAFENEILRRKMKRLSG